MIRLKYLKRLISKKYLNQLINYIYRFIARIYKNGVFRFLFVHDKEIEISYSDNSESKSDTEEYYDKYTII